MEYTKGEWKFVKGEFNCDSDIEENNFPMPGSIICEPEHWFICRIDNAPEHKVNAHLIAAAPDMYEALIQCSEILLNHGFGQFSCIKLAQKALAKAEGK